MSFTIQTNDPDHLSAESLRLVTTSNSNERRSVQLFVETVTAQVVIIFKSQHHNTNSSEHKL